MIKFHVFFFFLIFTICLAGCSQKPDKNTEIDSLFAPAQHITEIKAVTEKSAVDKEQLDSIRFNYTIEKQSYMALTKLQGKIFKGYPVDVDLLNLYSKNPEVTLAVWVTSSDSTYENDAYWYFKSYLVVFEQLDDSLRLVDQVELGVTNRYQLESSGISVESFEVHDTGSAIAVTSFSKEEGAGDSGFNKEELNLYVLLADRLTNILAINTRDDSFSNCECDDWDGYSSANKSSTVDILDTAFEHFFDLRVQETWSNSKDSGETTTTTYRWRGIAYAALEEVNEQ